MSKLTKPCRFNILYPTQICFFIEQMNKCRTIEYIRWKGNSGCSSLFSKVSIKRVPQKVSLRKTHNRNIKNIYNTPATT